MARSNCGAEVTKDKRQHQLVLDGIDPLAVSEW